MRSSRQILSSAIIITALILGATITIHNPHQSISQQYYPADRKPTSSYYAYHPDYSIFLATSSDNGQDDERDDDDILSKYGGGEDGTGDTTEICNRYLEECPKPGTSVTTGTNGSSCNKLFESCPITPTPTPIPTPTPKPTPTPTPTSPTAETPIPALTNATTDASLSNASGNLTCPRDSGALATSSSDVPAQSGGESDYNFLRNWTVQFSPASLTLDKPSDSVFISDYSNNRIHKFNSNGTFLTTWGTQGSAESQFSNPEGISADVCTGDIFVADTDNHRIQKFNSNGTFLTTWGTQGSADGQFNHPYGVAADGLGNVFVSDYDNHRIQKFNSNGTFLTTWGTQGSADGQLSKPDGISIDDGSQDVYVSDGGNSRIQVFSNAIG
jgi:hypothetical protein